MKGDNIMLNKEKYAKEILDIVCHDGVNPGIIDNIPVNCLNTECHRCQFYDTYCVGAFVKWANSEYKEREIDWSKVPVDTPDDGNTYKRYCAVYDKMNNMIIAFDNGGTSWSSGATTTR